MSPGLNHTALAEFRSAGAALRPSPRGDPASRSAHFADRRANTQDAHLKERVRAGDEAHVPAREDMKGRWRRPRQSLGWYRDVKKRFADLPED